MDRTRQELISAIGATMQGYQRSTDAFDEVVAERLGLNRTDLRCLDFLFDGSKRAGQLAEAVGLSAAATTTLLDRLEARDLVRRVHDTADRRQVLVEMTELGRRRTGEFYGPLADEGAAMLERYNDAELAAISDYLRRATELTERHRTRARRGP